MRQQRRSKTVRIEYSEPRYIISIAADMLGVHVQTLRYYERAGVIEPSRSRGNRRLYSQEDIERLRRVKTLMEDLGVNLAGVEVIMRMGQRMVEMEREIQELEERVKRLTESEV
jgi:MerR family transcriptional regulator/heat shock protein HspR